MAGEPTAEQTAVRVLFLLDRMGDPCDGAPGTPAFAVRVVRSERKLAKLDFLLRNPDYLADAIISAWEKGCLPGESLLDARAVLEEREPDLHTYRMLRNRHGAFEPLHNALSVLRYRGLIEMRRAGATSDEFVRRRDYFLLEAGVKEADRLRALVPQLAWYDEQARYVAMVAEGLSGADLKALQYGHDEYASTPIGHLIAGIADRVRSRLAAALERENLA